MTSRITIPDKLERQLRDVAEEYNTTYRKVVLAALGSIVDSGDAFFLLTPDPDEEPSA